jgi:hypothetical protein
MLVNYGTLNSWNSNLLKMDYREQTAILLAIFVLAGMMFLVPAITEKALASIHAVARGTCGSTACQFTFLDKWLYNGRWTSEPTKTGTLVQWSTVRVPSGNELGSVTYRVLGLGTAVLYFDNPTIGSNSCRITTDPSTPGQSCHAGSGYNARFDYTLKGK